MQRKVGDYAVTVRLPTIDGTTFDTEALKGKRYMLAFFRFASCPFCNMRMRELSTRYAELGHGFQIVAVFDSPVRNLTKHAQKHQAPFIVGADRDNRYYRVYGIQRSLKGAVKGIFTRMPVLWTAMVKHRYLPRHIQGHIATMPATFLIDERGIIRQAYYGKDEGDHLNFETIRSFALNR